MEVVISSTSVTGFGLGSAGRKIVYSNELDAVVAIVEDVQTQVNGIESGDIDIPGKTLVTPTTSDLVLVADASDSNNLKKVTVGSIVNLVDTSVDIVGKTTVTPATNDLLLISDTSDSNNLKNITVSSLIALADSQVSTISSSATLANENIVLAVASGGDVTLTLPAAASSTNKMYRIKKIDSTSNLVIIDPNASETIDGQTTLEISVQWVSVTIVCNGTAWFIV